MKKIYEVGNLRFENNFFYIEVDGKEFVFDLKNISERLFKASLLERNTFEILASGYGIHWPLIDEDLSIKGLLNLYNITQQKKDFQSKTNQKI